MSDVLHDADHVNDALYLAAVERASSSAEQAFRDVLLFHRDVLNGGLSQAIDNKRDDLDQYVAAFDRVGLGAIAATVRLARQLVVAAAEHERFPDDALESLTGLYLAATYNLAYVAAGYRDDPDFSLEKSGDQVERIALRFARNSRAEFAAVVTAVEAKR